MTLLDAYLLPPMCYFTLIILRAIDDFEPSPTAPAVDVVCVAAALTLFVFALSVAWPAIVIGKLLTPEEGP